MTPGAAWAWGGRGSGCGPEPSLRTAPCSSSLPPTAAAFGFRRAHLNAPPTPGPRHTGLGCIQLFGRWGEWGSLASCRHGLGVGASCGARPRPAARAAFGGLRGVLRRCHDASRVGALCLGFLSMLASVRAGVVGSFVGCLTPSCSFGCRIFRSLPVSDTRQKCTWYVADLTRVSDTGSDRKHAVATIRHFKSSARWAARKGRQAQDARRRAAHHHPPHPTGAINKTVCASAKRTRPQRPHAQMPTSRRPRGSSSATPQIPFPDHRSCSAPYPDTRSTASRSPGTRAPSMRPRESVGVAEGEDEDDEGEVRSEGSGPQSWALAAPATAASGDLRRSDVTYEVQKQPMDIRCDLQRSVQPYEDSINAAITSSPTDAG
ncbi:hypothetical protein SAMN05428937_2195 [Achromobacter sp. MFA1 R4]|nr:hypothetical protein SAMN05428937_2195 [Achromobacter sp. MFA1 R4]